MFRFLRQSRYASRLALKLPFLPPVFFRRRSVVAEHEQSQPHHKTSGAEDDEDCPPVHIQIVRSTPAPGR